jgi:LuxR family transcriptional regulator, maltose regulon positive regulatory protein
MSTTTSTTTDAPRTLDERIERAGGPVQMLRNAPVGAYPFPIKAEFTNWRDEQRAWRTTATLMDSSFHMTDFYFKGPDVKRLLSDTGLNSLANFGTDRAKQFVACNHEGYVIADAILMPFAEDEAVAEQHGWGTEWIIAPALVTLANTMAWTGEFDEAERWLQRTVQALKTHTRADIRLLVHQTSGMLAAARGRHHEALEEFSAAESLQARLESSHACAAQVTGWMVATQARLGMTGQASTALAARSDEQAGSGELGNARAVICLAEGDPAGSLGAVRDVLDGAAPVIGYMTVVEAHLLAGLAYRELGDQRAANEAAERALALAEADRLMLPFAMTGARELLAALRPHETAHAALLADILDVLRGSSVPLAEDCAQLPQELSPGELRVLHYLPTNLSRQEIARELSVSVNTVSTQLRRIYTKLGANDRSEAVDRARELGVLTSRTRRRA